MKIEPPKPSPLPWRARASRARGPFGAVEIEWIIVDADGRTVGTFDREEDAHAMLSVLPGAWPARATKVLR